MPGSRRSSSSAPSATSSGANDAIPDDACGRSGRRPRRGLRWQFRRGVASGSASTLSRMPMAVREPELDLDAFEGPFDLLLSLVLPEELPLRELDLAESILSFIEDLPAKGEPDL